MAAMTPRLELAGIHIRQVGHAAAECPWARHAAEPHLVGQPAHQAAHHVFDSVKGKDRRERIHVAPASSIDYRSVKRRAVPKPPVFRAKSRSLSLVVNPQAVFWAP